MASKIKVDEIEEQSSGSNITLKNNVVIPTGKTLTITDGIAASKITSGTFPDARISQSSVTQHTVTADLTPAKHDIAMLALQSAVADNKAAFNLTNSFIDKFEDATGIGTETDGFRASGYWATVRAEDLVINLGTEQDSGFSGAGTGEVNLGALDLINNNWGDYNSWTSRATNQGVNDINGDVGEFGSHATIYKASTWNFGAIRCWSGHPNPSSHLGSKDCAVYTSTDTSNGIDGTWIIQTPVTFDASTNADSNFRKRGQRTSQIIANHFILSGHFNNNNSTVAYSDTAAFNQVTGIKGVRLDIRTGWDDNYYDPQKPHMAQIQIFDDGGVATSIESATGTLIGVANVPSSAQTKVSGVALYKDNAGTATIGTDLKIYFTCNGGTNWTEAASYTAVTPVFSTGIKMLKLGETTCTEGSDVRYKAVWANQASGSKETQLHGIGLNY